MLAALLAAFVFLLALPAAVRAQERATESFLRQQRLIDDQLRQDRAAIAPLDARVDWEWGGWIDYYYFNFDDGLQSSRVYHRPGAAFWSRLSLEDGAHQFFARVRLNYNYFHEGDEFDRQQDWVGPNFDRAFYQLDLARALRAGGDGRFNLTARIGRQEVLFGTGYVLDLPMDAVTLDARLDKLRLTTLVAKTIGSTPNIDRSDPVNSHSNRLFLGAQLTYEGFERHQPFAYALWNNDRTDERPVNPLQEYSYDTAYFGFGSRGALTRGLSYWAEAAYENGKSWGDGDFFGDRDDVSAWALDAGIEQLWDGPYRPRASFEYMFASGDNDRVFSPTSAAGGNRGDSDDHSFVGFGYRDTGIALAPGLSNIHVWRAGAAFTPLPTVEPLRDFELGTNWFLYHKNQSRGAITDTTADMFHGYVGWEMDYFLNWRLSSDLSWTIRWGVFFPGDAFSDRDTRNFLLTGVTWSF